MPNAERVVFHQVGLEELNEEKNRVLENQFEIIPVGRRKNRKAKEIRINKTSENFASLVSQDDVIRFSNPNPDTGRIPVAPPRSHRGVPPVENLGYAEPDSIRNLVSGVNDLPPMNANEVESLLRARKSVLKDGSANSFGELGYNPAKDAYHQSFMKQEKPVIDVEFEDPMRTAYFKIAESVAAGEENMEISENPEEKHVPADPDQGMI